ncbi:hypothetical protein FI98_03839 [Mycobacterium tuberculosis]|nr:hypothetical protein FI98_03839 [Mycobacterium tuberculosis]
MSEVSGWLAGLGRLHIHYSPPVGSVLYWMRFGTIRLPPWPDRVPWIHGTRSGHGGSRMVPNLIQYRTEPTGGE